MLTPREAIDEIVGWARTVYALPSGGFTRGRYRGEYSTQTIFNDLGDYVPFLDAAGATDLAAREVEGALAACGSRNLLPSEFFYGPFAVIRSYEHTDFLLGLLDWYEQHPSPALHIRIEHILETVLNTFFPENTPHSWYVPSVRWRVPLWDGKDGQYVELLCDAARVLAAPSYEQRAREIAGTMQRAVSERGMQLMPRLLGSTPMVNHAVRLRRSSRDLIPAKYISNWAWGMLTLGDRDACMRISDAIATQVCNTDGALLAGGSVHLVHNFPFIDWWCDVAHTFHNEHALSRARRCADFWLTLQNDTTGLIPVGPERYDTDADTVTDMIIALTKVGELMGEKKYIFAADRMYEGVMRYHRNPAVYGYAHSVDVRTGAHIDGEYKTKFVLLWLKVLLLRERGGTVYGDASLWRLLRDR